MQRKRKSATFLSSPICALLLLLNGCSSTVNSRKGTPAGQRARSTSANVFDNCLESDSAPADGFDFPVGDTEGKGAYIDRSTGKRYDGWYIATKFGEEYSLGIHPGEDWNGTGGGDTDLGQEVHAVANGRVVFAEDCGRLWGNLYDISRLYEQIPEGAMVVIF